MPQDVYIPSVGVCTFCPGTEIDPASRRSGSAITWRTEAFRDKGRPLGMPRSLPVSETQPFLMHTTNVWNSVVSSAVSNRLLTTC